MKGGVFGSLFAETAETHMLVGLMPAADGLAGVSREKGDVPHALTLASASSSAFFLASSSSRDSGCA